MDEQRGPFQPTLWDSQPAAGQTLQQAWFAGVHSDVGGGYPEHGLSDLAFDWMMDCAATAGAEPDPDVVNALGTKPDATQAIHDSLKGLFKLNTFDRQIGATQFKTEYFHRSLVEKWGKDKNYRPKPLKPHAAKLDALAAGALGDVLYAVA